MKKYSDQDVWLAVDKLDKQLQADPGNIKLLVRRELKGTATFNYRFSGDLWTYTFLADNSSRHLTYKMKCSVFRDMSAADIPKEKRIRVLLLHIRTLFCRSGDQRSQLASPFPKSSNRNL